MENASNINYNSSASDNGFDMSLETTFYERLEYLENWIKNERKLGKIGVKADPHGFEQTCPLLFTADERANPNSIIASFFSAYNLLEIKQMLRNWFKAALTEDVKYDNGSELLFFHNQLIQLFQAGYQLIKSGYLYKGDTSGSDLKKGGAVISCLDVVEQKDPLKYLKIILNVPSLTTLRFGMLEWLYSALSLRSSIIHHEPKLIFEQFEILEKLLEAFFLINFHLSEIDWN